MRMIILLAVLISISSCRNSQHINQFVYSKVGKDIVISEEHFEDHQIRRIDSLCNISNFIITTTVHDNACTSCYFSMLKDMDVVIDSCECGIGCVVFIKNEIEEYASLQQQYDLCHVLFIYDPDDYYSKDNRLEKYTADYRTFLIDANRIIQLVGSSITNPSILKLYIKYAEENRK